MVRFTVAAGAYTLVPPCETEIEHDPTAKNVTVTGNGTAVWVAHAVPDTETDTSSPESECTSVVVNVNDVAALVFVPEIPNGPAGWAKVIVWGVLLTVTVRVTDDAIAKMELPACDAVTEQESPGVDENVRWSFPAPVRVQPGPETE